MVLLKIYHPIAIPNPQKQNRIMGSVFSAIGRGINAIIGAIANVIMTIVSAITYIIVSIFDVITDILCCRCGRRAHARRTGRTKYRRMQYGSRRPRTY
ncbi:hypothetical protein BKA70DRAFT_534347 [Coprinopsis sp. MPI-PUGE-AT-0042]|nr:hypothetical protein BKA70DRAFT_534347 [Coprinopsis sp. MPI-PUGE-AT-0042]